MTVGENIKRIRKERCLIQKKLGELCGIAESNIRKYENGKQNPKIETIEKIADALGVPEYELRGLDGSIRVDMTTTEDLLQKLKLYEEQQKELNKDNDIRHYLLTYYYNELERTGRDSLMEILASLKTLNTAGQKEASKRVEELTEIPRYTKPDEPPQE